MEQVALLRSVALGRGLEAETLNWVLRCTSRPSARYIQVIDRFIRAGKRNGWWVNVGDILCLGADTQQAALEGLKGVFRAADMTIVGTVVHEPSFGMSAGSANAYVDTNILVANLPGVTLNAHSLAVVCTTDLAGSWQEAGGSGTAGLKSFMIRASSGFRSGFWSAADQIIFGGTSCAGLVMGVRNNSGGGFCLRTQEVTAFTTPALSLPNADFTFLKSHPASVGSPNRVFLVMVGNGGWTETQALAFSDDVTALCAAMGRFDEIRPESDAFGAACFGNNALAGVLPAGIRIFQQSNPPATDTTDFDGFSNFPGTDWIARPYGTPQTNAETMATDPVATVNGQPTVTVTHVAHGLAPGDTATLAGLTDGNGFTAAQINREQVVVSAPTADTFTCVPAAGVNANATGNIGGAAGAAAFRMIRLNTSTYTITAPNRFHAFAWSNRGERAFPGGPIVTKNLKPNDLNPPIIRRTAPFNGVSCRTAFSTHERAIGATLVYIAHLCGYADRDEPSDVLNQGYLDIAEFHDLNAADVRTWADLCDNKETVFNIGLQGFAVCYDIAYLSPKRLADMTQAAWPKAVMLDLEHADNRTSTKQGEFLERAGQICHAKGYHFGWIGHFMNGDQAASNGFTPGPDGIAPTVINDPNIDYCNIIARQITNPPDIVDSLNAQRDYFKDAGGNVPMSKILVSDALGTGQQQVSLEKCAQVAAWQAENGITKVHISRVAMSQGGHELRPANQQQVAYLPNLSTRAITAAQFAEAYDRKVAIGATRKGQITTLIQGLIDDGTWWLIDGLWMLAAENETQALTDVRNRTLAVKVGAPVFTIDRQYAFDGVGDYLASGFIPAINGHHMTGSSQLLGVWERVTASHAGYSAGAFQSATRNLAIIANDAATGHTQIQANSALTTAGGSGIVDGDGFYAVTRSGTDLSLAHVRQSDGAPGSTGPIVVPSTALDKPNRELYIGARNNIGTADGFRAASISAVVIGAGLTISQAQSIGSRIRAHLVAIGAV